ncbi:MAG: hypothetical protein ABF430_09250, partial [Acetobacter persici]
DKWNNANEETRKKWEAQRDKVTNAGKNAQEKWNNAGQDTKNAWKSQKDRLKSDWKDATSLPRL